MKRLLWVGMSLVLMSGSLWAGDISGFRSAKFGQKESELLSAIKKDLSVTDKEINTLSDPQTSMRVFSVKLKSFEPLDAPAVVNYVLGFDCACLTQVSINWDVASNKDQKTLLMRLGSLVNYFQAMSWKEGQTVTSKLLGTPVKIKNNKDKNIDANVDGMKNIVLIYDRNTEKVDSYFIQPGKF